MNTFIELFIKKIRSEDHVIAENDYNITGDLDDMNYHLGKLDACEVIEQAYERMKDSDTDLETFYTGFFDQMEEAYQKFLQEQQTALGKAESNE